MENHAQETDDELRTFMALKRVPYNMAAAIYCIECWGLHIDAPDEEKRKACEPELLRNGWSYNDLQAEGQRRLIDGED